MNSKKTKKIALYAGAIIILLIALYNHFFAENTEVIKAYNETRSTLVVDGTVTNEVPEFQDGEVLVSLDAVKKYIDSNIWWDEKLSKVTVTTKDKVIRMKTESLEAFVNNKPINLRLPAVRKNGTIFVPIVFLSDFYKMKIEYKSDTNIIIAEKKSDNITVCDVKDKKTVLRATPSKKSPIVWKLDINKDEDRTLRFFKDVGGWYKVRTYNGIVGYVKKTQVEKRLIEDETVKSDEVDDDSKNQSNSKGWDFSQGKIILTWETFDAGRPNLDSIGKKKGLNVISPSWFHMIDGIGNLSNIAYIGFVDWAHANDYKIWALVSNSFEPKITSEMLNNTDNRENLIRQILTYSALYKIDGINIDFENMNKNDRDAFTQFIRELVPMAREQGLVVSVDVTVPDGSDNWSLCYDRKALADVVDFVMVMTYDQYWATSPVAGSVAQYVWVEKSIIRMLEFVPREKLVLGIPFYTRIWTEEKKADGSILVKSKDVSMETAWKIANENNAQITWDKESGQNYAEYIKDGKTQKIWLEDEDSINLKASLALKYDLAGICTWKRGLEKNEVWDILYKVFFEKASYKNWVEEFESKYMK